MKFLSVLAIALLMCTVTHAEPSGPVKWLMNEPYTLWDHGVDSLQEGLNVIVMYDWEENKLTLVRPSLEAKDYKAAKRECRDTINLIRKRLLVKTDGTLAFSGRKPLGGSSALRTYFAHNGFELRSRPNKLGMSLDQITVVMAQIRVKDSGDTMFCKVNLRGDKIHFSAGDS